MDISPARNRRTTLLRDEATIAGRLIILVAAVGILVWLLMQVQIVTVAAFFGMAIAAMLWPVVKWMNNAIPKILAVLISVVLLLAVIALSLWFVGDQFFATLPDVVVMAQQGIDAAAQWLSDRSGNEFFKQAQEQINKSMGQIVAEAGNIAQAGVSAVSSFVTIVILAIMVMIFTLASGDTIGQGIVKAVPTRWKGKTQASGEALVKTARNWLFASIVTGLVDGIFIALGLSILKVPLAVPIGMLTFFAGFIPNIGAILAGAVAVAVALASGGLTTAIWALVVVIVVQQVEGSVLQPLLMSRAMDFPPLITLLLTTAGGLAFGLTGLILTVPLVGFAYAVIRAWNSYGKPTADSDDSGESDLESGDDSDPDTIRKAVDDSAEPRRQPPVR